MEETELDLAKARAETFIKMLRRGQDACERSMGALTSGDFSVGETALGALYMLDFYKTHYPVELLAAEGLMAAYHGLKDDAEKEVRLVEKVDADEFHAPKS